MSWIIGQFVASVAVIVVAGTVLARCADAIATATGLGRLLVGSVLLAGATSLPELMIGLNAVWLNRPDIAVGDLAGSNLLNLLILAVADLAQRTRGAMLSHVAAGHALSGVSSIALAALAGMAILLEPEIATDLGWAIGPGSIAILLAFAFGTRLVFCDQQTSRSEAQIEAVLEHRVGDARKSTWKPVVGYLIAAATICAVAPTLARSAGGLADASGLSGTFVGTTLVALATSLPELAVTVAAVRMGSFDLAIGNVFGSNAFNILLLVPLDLAFPGSLFAAISTTHAITFFAVILVGAVVLLGQLYRVERRILFLEPDAVLVIVLVCASLWLVYVAS